MRKFILGDCMDKETGLPSYPDNHFDLAIVDPPYGIGAAKMSLGKGGGVAKSNNHKKKKWDKSAPCIQYFNHLKRVSKNQIIWGGNYYDLGKTKGWIVWKKMDIKNDYNPLEMAWTSNLKMGFIDFLWCGMWQADMKNKETRIHPTQKPVALYRWLLENYAQPGDLILDTHVGSASSLIACESMGFDYVGFEIDPDYYEAAKNRMSKGIQQVIF